MATLMQAVERVRNDGQLPVTGQVSLRDLHARFPPGQRGSLRSVQDQMFQGAAKKPWAIILCRFKNEPADPAREGRSSSSTAAHSRRARAGSSSSGAMPR